MKTLQRGSPSSRRPPLPSVEDVPVATPLDPGLDVGRVGRGDIGFRHREGGADLPPKERVEPLALDRLGGVSLQRLHVAGVRRGAVEYLARAGDPTHDLAERCVLEVRQALRDSCRARQEEVPETGFARLRLQLLDYPGGLPGISPGPVLRHLPVKPLLVRVDVLVEEIQKTSLQGLDTVRELEVHDRSVDGFGTSPGTPCASRPRWRRSRRSASGKGRGDCCFSPR
jgi:hypothetical protein